MKVVRAVTAFIVKWIQKGSAQLHKCLLQWKSLLYLNCREAEARLTSKPSVTLTIQNLHPRINRLCCVMACFQQLSSDAGPTLLVKDKISLGVSWVASSIGYDGVPLAVGTQPFTSSISVWDYCHTRTCITVCCKQWILEAHYVSVLCTHDTTRTGAQSLQRVLFYYLCICIKFHVSNHRRSVFATKESMSNSGISRCLPSRFPKVYGAPEILKKCPESPNALDRETRGPAWEIQTYGGPGKAAGLSETGVSAGFGSYVVGKQ